MFHALLKNKTDDKENDEDWFVEKIIPFMPTAIGVVVQEVVDRVDNVEDAVEKAVNDIKHAIVTPSKKHD
jgi:hypothetical protein